MLSLLSPRWVQRLVISRKKNKRLLFTCLECNLSIYLLRRFLCEWARLTTRSALQSRNSKVAADWHELTIPQHTMRSSVAYVNEHLNPQCTMQTYHCRPTRTHWAVGITNQNKPLLLIKQHWKLCCYSHGCTKTCTNFKGGACYPARLCIVKNKLGVMPLCTTAYRIDAFQSLKRDIKRRRKSSEIIVFSRVGLASMIAGDLGWVSITPGVRPVSGQWSVIVTSPRHGHCSDDRWMFGALSG